MKKNNIFSFSIIFLFIIVIISAFNKNLFSYVNSFVWMLEVVLMFYSGIFLSKKFNFIQLRFDKILKSLKGNNKSSDKISLFESLSLSLAARVGVGSLAGISLAIYIGGAGSIFWMWIVTIICAINTYVESALGVLYQNKDYGNIYIGGPSYYIKNGLNDKLLACLYAFFIIISYIFGFIPIQANTIIKSTVATFNINPYFIIIILIILTFLVIFKGLKKIANITAKIVPLMMIIYLLIGLYIIIVNFSLLPIIIKKIIVCAFDIKSILGGSLIIGIQRGIFATEAGVGTSAISAASVDGDYKKSGLSQVLGIYFTSFIICTITAFIVLISNYHTLNLTDVNGIEITLYAFNYTLGHFGKYLLCLLTILFAYTTIISGYYYGEASLKFLNNKISPQGILLFKVLVIVLIFLGAIIKATMIWKIIDTFLAFLAIINIYALLKLFYKVK